MLKITINFYLIILLGFVLLQAPYVYAQELDNTALAVFSDDFSGEKLDTTNWFAELGKLSGNTVTTNAGQLIIDANYGATVWFKHKLSDNWIIEFDRVVLVEGKSNDRLADFNFFWQAADPTSDTLFGNDPLFKNYDKFNLYYLGIGGHDNSTSRFRKYIGNSSKEIIVEYTDSEHLLESNRIYHCRFEFRKNISSVYIDNELFLQYIDEKPYKEGYFGFRTFRSRQAIMNFKVKTIR